MAGRRTHSENGQALVHGEDSSLGAFHQVVMNPLDHHEMIVQTTSYSDLHQGSLEASDFVDHDSDDHGADLGK